VIALRARRAHGITQAGIDAFADVTDDDHWIQVDAGRKSANVRLPG